MLPIALYMYINLFNILIIENYVYNIIIKSTCTIANYLALITR